MHRAHHFFVDDARIMFRRSVAASIIGFGRRRKLALLERLERGKARLLVEYFIASIDKLLSER